MWESLDIGPGEVDVEEEEKNTETNYGWLLSGIEVSTVSTTVGENVGKEQVRQKHRRPFLGG